jgi:CheY-like chemotaxis protein
MMVLEQSAAAPIVLVVEDEMMLRMRAVDMVEDAGFTSLEATDAEQAIAILESRSDIALLFTDIQMPGKMDGLGLAHVVHERWPPIKIILASGQLNPTKTDIPAGSQFFGKPLAADEMIAEMRTLIGHA